MLCYHFPPQGGIASLRALRFARHLPETGWQPRVVTPAQGRYVRDGGLFWPGPVVGTPSLELQVRPGRIGGSSESDAPAGAWGRVRKLLRNWLYFPDGHVGWYPFALEAGRRLLRERRVDAIFSTAYPVTSHLVARQLKRESRLPWVAEYRDLWTDWSQSRGLRLRRERRLEMGLLTEADAIVATSVTHASVLERRSGVRGFVITNGFDPECYPWPGSPTGGASRSRIVAHLGTYYPAVQEMETALAGLALARKRTAPGLRLRLIGTDAIGLRSTLERHGLENAVERFEFCPHVEASGLLASANLALLGGPREAQDETRAGWIPAKVFEYLGSGLPVLMVGDPRAEVAQILARQSHCQVVATGDVEGAASALAGLSVLPRVRRGRDVEAYASRELTRRLAEVLVRVTEGKPA